MGIEIERKFLINKERLIEENPSIFNCGIQIQQGYIAKTEDHTVIRIRLADNRGYITIKSANIGSKRAEFEYEIPFNDAQEMLDTLCSKRIKKVRYLLPTKTHTWEIDVFELNNKGLIIAEIELESENELFELPSWIVKDVTNDKQFYNSNLLNKEEPKRISLINSSVLNEES